VLERPQVWQAQPHVLSGPFILIAALLGTSSAVQHRHPEHCIAILGSPSSSRGTPSSSRAAYSPSWALTRHP